MRLFLGVFPPARVRGEIERVVSSLRELPGLGPGRAGPRWVRPERWHVTLSFLGDRAPEVVPAILECGREAVARLPRFELDLDGVGGFPNARRARVLWLGIGRGRAQLEALAETVLASLEAIGIEREARPFHPHLTLARAGSGALRVPGIDVAIGGFEVTDVSIVHSVSGHGGGYDTLARWPLGV